MFGLFRKLRQKFQQINVILEQLHALKIDSLKIREALGRIESRQLEGSSSTDLRVHEFRVFSQFGEDGIIQYLLRHVPVERRIFVEFGVGDYSESNTRFLLVKDRWSGLVLDADREAIARLRADPILRQHDLKAASAFITRDNINDLIKAQGIEGEIGLLSIDIDGNDYWVWQALDVVRPAIVVVEYNFRFGPQRAVTIPYQADFSRERTHYSLIYFGASLPALCNLAQKKGYAFVGCNSAGVNAFFVRRSLKPAAIPELTAAAGFVGGQLREARTPQGDYALLTPDEEDKILANLPLVEVGQ